MTDLHELITEIDSYCAARGIKPDTLCRMATNNARLYDRLHRRAEKTVSDMAAIRDYMAANPVQTSDQSGAA